MRAWCMRAWREHAWRRVHACACREEKEGVLDDDLDEAGSAMPASGPPGTTEAPDLHGGDYPADAH